MFYIYHHTVGDLNTKQHQLLFISIQRTVGIKHVLSK